MMQRDTPREGWRREGRAGPESDRRGNLVTATLTGQSNLCVRVQVYKWKDLWLTSTDIVCLHMHISVRMYNPAPADMLTSRLYISEY